MTATTSAPTGNCSALETLEALGAMLEPELATWQSNKPALERRESTRLPLGQDICVIGLDDHFHPATEPLLMEGRDVSGQGASFCHSAPITTRFAAISFRVAAGLQTVVVKLSWCRFSRPGSYVSGGKFIKHRPTVTVPTDWSALRRG